MSQIPLTAARQEQNQKVLDDLQDTDPAAQFSGMAPNFGQYALPQIFTVNALANALGRVYRASDEALKASWEEARFMRNDTGIMECIEARQRSVALLDWHLEPENSKDPAQEQLCADLKAIVERIPWFLKWRENLLHGIWYGNYAVQNKFQWANIAGKMRVGVADWRPINGDKLVFRYDDGSLTAGQVGVRVGWGYRVGDLIDGKHRVQQVEPTVRGLCYFLKPHERKLLTIHKHQIEDGAYETPEDAGKIHGVGVRSKIYWDWFQKQSLLAFLMEFLERSAFGFEIWYYPSGSKGAEEMTRKAAQERSGQFKNIILVPKPLGEESNAYGVERIEPGVGGAEVLIKIVEEYFGHRIKRYILGQTLTSEADATGLGSGVADIHLGTFLDIVRYDAVNLEESITKDLIAPLKAWNFPQWANTLVRFKIDTESEDAMGKLDANRKAWEMGAKIKTEDIYRLLQSSAPGPDDEFLQSPQFGQIPSGDGGFPGAAKAPSPQALEQFRQDFFAKMGAAA